MLAPFAEEKFKDGFHFKFTPTVTPTVNHAMNPSIIAMSCILTQPSLSLQIVLLILAT